MVKVFEKFGGAIFLYAVIFFGIVAIASRVGVQNQASDGASDEVIALNQWIRL